MDEVEQTVTAVMTTVQITRDLHRWLKIEAAERGSTVTAELAEAVELLRAAREGGPVIGSKALTPAVQVQQ